MRTALLWAASLASASAATSKLAPTLSYAGKSDSVHAFLHSYDSLPKVLLLRDTPSEEPPKGAEEEGGDGAAASKASAASAAGEPPSWFTSVAVYFKEGRKKSASFAMIEGADAKKVAARFGVQGDLPATGIIVGCAVDGQSSGTFAVFDGYLGEGGGKAVREVRTWVQTMVDGKMEGEPLPAFPPPDVPRKSASVSLRELTHDNLPTHCFGGSKSLCVIALLPRGATAAPDAFKSLAARHRNDPVAFVWLKTRGQAEFIAAFGAEDDGQMPRLVAVKFGKRPRYALSEPGAFEVPAMGAFIDTILGGGASFKKLAELPELTPPYLMEPEDKDEM